METFARSDAESPQGMDGLIAELLSSLIRIAPEDFAAAIETALRRIGERLDVDIATIVEFDGGGQSTDGGFHWVRRTLTSVDVLADIKRLAALMHSLDVGSEPMILERIPDQLPRELLASAALDAAHGPVDEVCRDDSHDHPGAVQSRARGRRLHSIPVVARAFHRRPSAADRGHDRRVAASNPGIGAA